MFCAHFGALSTFSGIQGSGLLPLRLHPDSPGLCMLACVVAAPLGHLGFEPAVLPEGWLGLHNFRCTPAPRSSL